MLGRYAFTLPDTMAHGELRPLRDPAPQASTTPGRPCVGSLFRCYSEPLMPALDRLTAPIRARADRVMVGIIGAFFVALFAAGTTILTPELLTGAAWVAWAQLGIALCLLSRRLY